MALKNDSETLTKELKAALKQGRNFVLSLGAKPKDGFLALSKKKIPQSETKAAKEKTKKKVFRGSCFKEGSTFVFETPLAVSPALKTKLKQMIKETTAFKVGKFEFRTNPEWAECEYEDEPAAGSGGGKGGSGGGSDGGGGTVVEEPPVDEQGEDEADAPSGGGAPAGGASGDTTTTSTPDTGDSPAAPAGDAAPSGGAAAPSAPAEDVNPFSGEASAATTAAVVDDVKGKTPEQALKALRKKIAELRSWGDRNASKLKKDAQEIEDLIAAESPEVGEKLKKLQKKLQPIYAEYRKQKKAKEKYDKQFPALKQKHDGLVKVGSYVPTFEPTLGDVAKQMAALAKEAKAKDYEAALKAVPGLEKEIAKVTADASSAVKMMIEYETRLAGLSQRLADAADPTGHDEGEQLQASMKTTREEMQDAFDKDDYADALDSLDALEIELTRFESVVGESRKHKDAYEKLVAEVEPAVKEALKQTVMNEGAQSTKEQLQEWFDDAQLKARDEEYFAALGSLEEAQQYLGEFKVKIDALAEDKKKYDEQMGKLAARVDEILTSVKGGPRENVQGYKDSCEEYAQAEDFAKAMADVAALEAQVLIAEAFSKELAEFETQYQNRLAELQPRIDAAFETVPDALQKRQTAITDKFRATEKLANDGSYLKAVVELDVIEVLLAAFEVARADSDDEKAQYDARYKELNKRWAKAAKPLKNADLVEAQEGFVEARAEIEAAADAGNYDEALTKMDLEEAGLTYFENTLAKQQAAGKEYKSRLKALRRSLDRVATADAGTLMGVQTEIGEKETEAKSSADDGEYGDALATLDWLESAVEGFLKQLEAGVGAGGDEADEAEYKKRIKPFFDRGKKAFRLLGRFSSERGDALKEQIDSRAAKMEEFARDDVYGQALATLFIAETDLTALENFLDQLQASRDLYDVRFAAIEPDLEKMRAPTKNEEVVKGQETVAEDVAEMEQFAADGDYEQAIASLDELVLLIPAFLQYVADHEGERQEYETRLAELGDRLKEADHPVTGTEIEVRQTDVKAARKRMEDAAKKDDFDTALEEMDALEAELAALAQLAETQGEDRAEYERRLPNATKLYKEIQAAVDSDALEESQKQIAELWAKMEEAADKGDYPEATRSALSIEAFGPAFAVERRRHDDDKKDFEKRFQPLKARADEVLSEISTTSEIVEGDTEIPKVLVDVDDLVEKGDYTAALGKLAKLEAEISAGEREVKELLRHKKAVDERLPAVRKGVKKAATPSDEDSVIEVQDKITELDEDLKGELSEEKWAAALDTIKALETELKVLDIVLQQAARIAAAEGDGGGGGGGAQESQGAAQNPFE